MFIYCVFGSWHLAAGHVLFLIWTCTCELSVGPVGCLVVSCLWLWVSRVLDLDHCLCVVALPACELWCTAVTYVLCDCCLIACELTNCDVLCVVASFWFCVAFIVSSVYASMHGCNYCVELTVLSGYMYIDVSVLCYRFPIVIDTFPIEVFRSRYPVISNSFSRPAFPFPLPFPVI